MADEDPIDYTDDNPEMTWESAARTAIEGAASTIEKDEIRGVIYMDDGEDHRFNPLRTEFTSWEDVMRSLLTLGENEWVNYVPFDGGEAVFEPNVDGYVHDVMSEYDVEGFFDSISPPDEGDELVDAHDLISHGAGLVLQIDLAEINELLGVRLRLQQIPYFPYIISGNGSGVMGSHGHDCPPVFIAQSGTSLNGGRAVHGLGAKCVSLFSSGHCRFNNVFNYSLPVLPFHD